MKTYLQNKKTRRKSKVWIYIFAGIVVLGMAVGGVRSFIAEKVAGIFSPAIGAGKSVASGSRWFAVLFKDKKEMEEGLGALKEENNLLKARLLEFDALKKENEELKSSLSQKNDKPHILGSVILRPPQSPYDIIVVDAGRKNGAEPGMRVIAYSNIIIGHVFEVYENTSKIKLLSFPGEQTGVTLPGAKIFALSAGLGGGNMEIKIPSSVVATTGDKITTGGTFPLMIGEVEKIEADKIDPFQKILFRTPVNLSELKSVLIEK